MISAARHRRIGGRSVLATHLLAVSFCFGVAPLQLRAIEPSRRISQYHHHHWMQEHGLPRNTVNTLAQTPDGYVWVGTSGGLARFNGSQFTVFNRESTPALPGNDVSALRVRSDGSLWIALRGSPGLLRYRAGVFEPAPGTEGIAHVEVLHLSEDRQGALWIGTRGAWSLGRLADGRLRTFGTNEGYYAVSTREVHPDAQGRIWGATDNGLFLWQGERFTNYATLPGYAHQSTYSLCFDREGTLWLGTEKGLSRFRDGGFTTFTTRDGLSNDRVETLFADRDGNVWIGTSWGLCRRSPQSPGIEAAQAPEEFDAVLCFLEDREGNLWVGTEHGLKVLSDSRFTFFAAPEGLRHQTLYSVLADREQQVWMGSWLGGVYCLSGGRFTNYTVSDGLSGNVITAIGEDSQGSLWFGTRDSGLNRYSQGVFSTLSTNQGLPDTRVCAVFEDRRGILWVGTGRGAVLVQGGNVQPLLLPGGPANPLVYTITETRDGCLWLGTEAGLWRKRVDQWTRFTPDQGLPGDAVYCVVEDTEGTVWVGAEGGMARLQGDRWKAFRRSDGLEAHEVYWIVDDRQGHLWFSSAAGIFSVLKRELDDFAGGRVAKISPQGYNSDDGLVSGECRFLGSPTGTRDREGRLWFATARGLAMVHPQRYRTNSVPPGVHIERIWVDGTPRSPQGLGLLKAGIRRLQVDYAALSYRAPEKVRYRTWLEGLDSGWSEPTPQTQQAYTRLSPGNYRFRVMACNDDGYWAESSQSLAFSLEPRFRETPWFYALMSLVAASAAWGLYRLRIQRHEHRARELAALVDERTDKLQVQIAERFKLEAQLRQAQKMEAIGQLAAGIAHDFNNMLTVIQGHASLLQSEPAQPGAVRESAEQIQASAQRAADLTRQLLAFSRKQMMNTRLLNLNDLVDNISRMLQRMLGDHITVEVQPDSGIPVVRADAGMIEQVIMNLAVNARDAMPKGGRLTLRTRLVEVTAEAARVTPEARPGRYACLIVSDTGCGMDAATLSRLFEPFFTTKEVGKGTGLGLASAYGIVRQHEGWIRVESTPGQGSSFFVHLPATDEQPTGTAAPAAQPPSRPGRGTILVVEDEPAVRNLVRRLLTAQGYKVLEATHGHEALGVWEREKAGVDLLLTDMVMPHGMSGRELAERLRAEKPSLRVIYSSGYSVQLLHADFAPLQGHAFLQKPYAADVLLRAVQECMDTEPAGGSAAG